MLAILIITLLAMGPILLACLIVHGLYRKASRADHLEGQLIESQKATEAWKDHAEKALRLAFEKHFPPDRVIEFSAPPRAPQAAEDYTVEVRHYVPPITTNCVKCGVSVREPKEAFPVPCPACRTLIDPVFDDPPLME